MTPTLTLGPWNSPSIEFMSRDIEPLIILLIQNEPPLGEQTLDSVWSFITLDTLHLREQSANFFLRLEDICRQVTTGQLVQFDAAQIPGSEFDGYLHRHLGDGSITLGTRTAAARFLEFLVANPDHWPPRKSAP